MVFIARGPNCVLYGRTREIHDWKRISSLRPYLFTVSTKQYNQQQLY